MRSRASGGTCGASIAAASAETMSSLRRRAICVQRAMSTERSSIGGRASARTTAPASVGIGQQSQPGQHVADLGPLEERRLADEAVGDRPLLQRHAHRLALVGDLRDEHRDLGRERPRLARSGARCRPPPTAPGSARWRSARARTRRRQPRPVPTGAVAPAPTSRRRQIALGAALACVERDHATCPLRREAAHPRRAGPAVAPQARVGIAGDRHRRGAPTPPGPASPAPGRAPGRRRAAGGQSDGRGWRCARARSSAPTMRSPSSRAPASASIRSWRAVDLGELALELGVRRVVGERPRPGHVGVGGRRARP